MFSRISLHKTRHPMGFLPGNRGGWSGGSSPGHVTAATTPCQAREPVGTAPPLPGTLRGLGDIALPLPKGPGMLRTSRRP